MVVLENLPIYHTKLLINVLLRALQLRLKSDRASVVGAEPEMDLRPLSCLKLSSPASEAVELDAA